MSKKAQILNHLAWRNIHFGGLGWSMNKDPMDEEPRQTTWWGKWGVGTSTPTINRYSGSRQQAAGRSSPYHMWKRRRDDPAGCVGHDIVFIVSGITQITYAVALDAWERCRQSKMETPFQKLQGRKNIQFLCFHPLSTVN